MIDDVVRVIDDMAEVHRLQKDASGWDDDMALVSLEDETNTLAFCMSVLVRILFLQRFFIVNYIWSNKILDRTRHLSIM